MAIILISCIELKPFRFLKLKYAINPPSRTLDAAVRIRGHAQLITLIQVDI